MADNDTLEELRADLDYDQLIERASPALRLYIRTLEQENARLRQEVLELRETNVRRQRASEARERRAESSPAQVATPRHPDDVMVISITAQGLAKRTPLNDYSTQRRGGAGVFDIQTSRDDLAAHLLVARASAALLAITNRGRGFRLPIDTLPLGEVRSRGASLPERLAFTPGETLAALLALDDDDPRSTVLVATSNGWVRPWHRNYLGPRLQPGTLLYDPQRGGGPPAAMILSDGEDDLLIALRSGAAYRFSESLVRRDGVRGIQVRPDDTVVGIASVRDESNVLLVTADGQGTRREMSGFAVNKSPGGQGKAIMKTDALVDLAAVGEQDEVLCISGFAKIIRFGVSEVPAKAGVVQGVAVMDCRGDSLAALAVLPQSRDEQA